MSGARQPSRLPLRLRADLAHAVGAAATHALLLELAAWPKPGLVSHEDSGSHRDMNAATLQASAAALEPFFAALALAGQEGAAMADLRAIGLRAEAAMLAATGGVNTHRGAIFGLGLLAAAAGATARFCSAGRLGTRIHLGRYVAARWGNEILRGPVPLFSHGTQALRRYGAGGARTEAASGFCSVYDIGLPALREGRHLAGPAAGAVQACFALIATVTDTNLLHRGGAAGAQFAAAAAAGFLAQGGVGAPGWLTRAHAVHEDFIARNLSPGGCADLLAMSLFIDALDAAHAP